MAQNGRTPLRQPRWPVTIRRLMVVVAGAGMVPRVARFLFVDYRPRDILLAVLCTLEGHSTVYADGYTGNATSGSGTASCIARRADIRWTEGLARGSRTARSWVACRRGNGWILIKRFGLTPEVGGRPSRPNHARPIGLTPDAGGPSSRPNHALTCVVDRRELEVSASVQESDGSDGADRSDGSSALLSGRAAEIQRRLAPQQNLYFSPLLHGHGA
jgi:hypothetical protein